MGGSTSLSDLRKCKAGTPLQVNIFRVHQGAKGLKRLSGEEIRFPTLIVRSTYQHLSPE